MATIRCSKCSWTNADSVLFSEHKCVNFPKPCKSTHTASDLRKLADEKNKYKATPGRIELLNKVLDWAQKEAEEGKYDAKDFKYSNEDDAYLKKELINRGFSILTSYTPAGNEVKIVLGW